MATTCTIGGVTKSLRKGWRISASLQAVDTLSCIVDSSTASYRPALGDEIIVTETSTRIFGGYIQSITEAGIVASGGTPIANQIEATDYTQLVTRRHVNETIAAGTLKAALIRVVTYLSAFGVTLDAAQVDGPSLGALVYDYRQVGEVLDELATLSGYVWELDYSQVLRMYSPGSVSAPFSVTAANQYAIGDVQASTTRATGSDGYANRVIVRGGTDDAPVTATANDTGEQTSYGIWETVIAAPTATDTTTAQALADAYLLQRLVTPVTVLYDTYQAGLLPGQTQTITFSQRNVDNSFLVTDVETYDDGANRVRRSVTAIEGSVVATNWRSLYQQWTGGAPTVFTSASAIGYGRQVYPLQLSPDIWTQDSTPTWVAAAGANGGIRVTIDTTLRGTTTATVRVRLRVRSGTVQARLYNVSDSTSVGTSSSVSTTSFTDTSFSVTLTAGAKVYELQVLPGSADVDVQAIGYLE